jgi:uncharacterized OB-fold protein
VSQLPIAAPPYAEEAAPFWTGAAEGRLVLPRCDACAHVVWYPRAWCPACGSGAVTWEAMRGEGTVYAVTVIRKAMGPWSAAAPYAAAYVELAEGPRLLANLEVDDPTSVRVGDAVVAVFVPIPDLPADAPPQAILRFRPR